MILMLTNKLANLFGWIMKARDGNNGSNLRDDSYYQDLIAMSEPAN